MKVLAIAEPELDGGILELAYPTENPIPDPVALTLRNGVHPWPEYKTISLDFEYISEDGSTPDPVCLVYTDWGTGEYHKVWRDELLRMKTPPFDTSKNTVVVAYYYMAEGSCFEVLGWEHPVNVVDIFAEFRCLTNGKNPPMGNSLLGAMSYYGIPSMAGALKENMRELILGGGPWTEDEKTAITEYCELDVRSLNQLVSEMAQNIDLSTALYRGRYCVSVSKMEAAGIPIDTEIFEKIQSSWPELMAGLVKDIDQNFEIFDGMTFKHDAFENYLEIRGIRWPRTATGRLDLKETTFKEKAQHYPQLELLRELRSTLSQTRNLAISVGKDGRNRVMLSPFGTKTSRHNPSTNKFVFGPAKCWRFLIKPLEGKAIAYLDYSQQEFGIGAALSGDENMKVAYRDEDPYLKFGKQAGQIPETATKETHSAKRAMFKTCSLGVLYGMSGGGMAEKLGIPKEAGRQLLNLHQSIYPAYWEWGRNLVSNALLRQEIQTLMGWKMFIQPRVLSSERTKARTVVNFPMQGNGAEMLRIAIIMAA